MELNVKVFQCGKLPGKHLRKHLSQSNHEPHQRNTYSDQSHAVRGHFPSLSQCLSIRLLSLQQLCWRTECRVSFLQSSLNGCFWLFTPKFWKMTGTYEWYFVIHTGNKSLSESESESFYECRLGGDTWGGGDTQILPYAKEMVWTFCTNRWWGCKSFGHECSHHHLRPAHLVKLTRFF